MKGLRAAAALSALLAAGCVEDPATRQWWAMDCNMSISLYGARGVPDESAFNAAERETARLAALFSDFDSASALSAVTGDSGDSVDLPPEIRPVLAEALSLQEPSRGTLDITLHGLKALWGIGTGREGHVPSRAEIDSAMAGNGAYGGGRPLPPISLLTDGRAVLRRSRIRLDLGGVAKGYITDRLHALLDSMGCPNHLIQAGGEIRTGGRRESGPWRIGIRHPRASDSLAGLTTAEGGTAVSTSGDYERFFLADGERWHHLFDPRTGKPSRTSCAVTVQAGSSLRADALTKPLFILGPDSGAALARLYGARAAWFREEDGRVCAIVMPEFRGDLELRGVPECAGVSEAHGPTTTGR